MFLWLFYQITRDYMVTFTHLCFSSHSLADLLNGVMGGWIMEKSVELATFHSVTLQPR